MMLFVFSEIGYGQPCPPGTRCKDNMGCIDGICICDSTAYKIINKNDCAKSKNVIIQSWTKKSSLFYAKINTVQIDQNE